MEGEEDDLVEGAVGGVARESKEGDHLLDDDDDEEEEEGEVDNNMDDDSDDQFLGEEDEFLGDGEDQLLDGDEEEGLDNMYDDSEANKVREREEEAEKLKQLQTEADRQMNIANRDCIANSKEEDTQKKETTLNTLWPEFEDKFRPGDVERIVETVVKEHLEGQAYDGEMPKLVKALTDAVQIKIKALKYKRYKIITHIALGERRGEGVTSVTRCIWDPMSDCMGTYTYLNETVFCCVTVYGVYFN